MSFLSLPNVLQALCWVCLLSTSFFFAGQIAPSGGPPDTTPPEIIATEPVPGSLNIHEGRIVLAFSKYVDHASVAGSLFISHGGPRLDTRSHRACRRRYSEGAEVQDAR